MKLDSITQIEWDFGDENADWQWCVANATFSHREACEFMLYIGDAALEAKIDARPYWKMFSEQMRNGGCSDGFIAAYLEAKDAGAMFALFWT